MSVGSTLIFPVSLEGQAEGASFRADAPSVPGAGNDSSGEKPRSQFAPQDAPALRDAVRVQWDYSDHIAIYQFVNHQGSVFLQVPSEQMLNLASGISQELAREAAPRKPAAIEGGKP